MNIKIPKEATKYILFQRTEYLFMARSKNSLVNFLYKVLSRLISFNQYIVMESTLFPQRIASAYSQDMEKEYQVLKNHLPHAAKNILDIGCGMAGIDAILYEHYAGDTEISLLDKSHIDKKVFYYFENTGSFYNSLPTAKHLLVLNGVNPARIHIQEATATNQILFERNFDLIISLISWGFHYPIAAYLDVVYEKMNKGGVLILDVRKDTNGGKLLEEKFGPISIILDEQKYQRILVVKK